MKTANSLLPPVGPPARAAAAVVRERLDSLTKPPGSLGNLEEVALRLALITGDPPPRLSRRTVCIMAADHGVTDSGVSAYPRDVTAQMCRNFVAGGAAINAIARSTGADVVVVDVGVDADLSDLCGVRQAKVARGTRNLAVEGAMNCPEMESAIQVGLDLADELAGTSDVIALGDMGIGNTTAAAALTAALTGSPPIAVTGRGTGIEEDARVRKAALIERALERLVGGDPLEALREVGGLEIAALTGLIVGAAARSLPVCLDGFITGSAALVAVALRPAAREYLFASHLSQEPGHRIQLDSLALSPPIRLDMRLGEGTGAALFLPVLDSAGAVLREMATFESAGVSRG